MTTIAIAVRNSNNNYRLVTMSDGDPVVVGQILKDHYNTLESINILIDRGNIITLANTIEECVFVGEPPQFFTSIDSQESEVTICDKNFFYIGDVWLVRDFDGNSYSTV